MRLATELDDEKLMIQGLLNLAAMQAAEPGMGLAEGEVAAWVIRVDGQRALQVCNGLVHLAHHEFGRALEQPDAAVVQARALRFRVRRWWSRFPFLPVPSRDYVRWRMYTAYGDHDAVPPVDDVIRYVREVAGRYAELGALLAREEGKTLPSHPADAVNDRMMDEFGLDDIDALAAHILRQSEQAARAANMTSCALDAGSRRVRQRRYCWYASTMPAEGKYASK